MATVVEIMPPEAPSVRVRIRRALDAWFEAVIGTKSMQELHERRVEMHKQLAGLSSEISQFKRARKKAEEIIEAAEKLQTQQRREFLNGTRRLREGTLRCK